MVPAFLCKGVAQALAHMQGEQDEVVLGTLILWYLIKVDGWGRPLLTSSRPPSSDSICSLGPHTSSAASTAHWCSGRLPNHELSFTSHLSQRHIHLQELDPTQLCWLEVQLRAHAFTILFFLLFGPCNFGVAEPDIKLADSLVL